MDAPRPLRFVKGVGPVRAAALAAVGWQDAWDVLHAVPRLLGPPPPLHAGGPLPEGRTVRLAARVVRARPSFRRGRGMGLEAELADAGGLPLRAVFFHAGFLRRLLVPGEWFLWEGRCERGALLHPSFLHLPRGPAELPPDPAVRTAYRLPAGIGERSFAAIVERVLADDLPLCPDPAGELPAAEYQDCLRTLHRPADAAAHESARRTVARRELLALAWLAQERRAAAAGAGRGRRWLWDDALHARALARLPFAPTPGQAAALAAIRADLQGEAPMYRLLHGEVGSGKTAVALVAALAVIAGGAQAAFLAPTAVLAAQVHAFCARCLAGSRVVCALLTAGAAERGPLLAGLADGAVHLVIGTHALLGDEVRFRDLGLAVVDEQQRFGVAQRAALAAKARGPVDLLVMTATPIPRTLALTAYGDLAVTRLEGRPPGRGPVATRVAPWPGADALAAMLSTSHLPPPTSHQSFIVCPRKEPDGSGLDAASIHAALAQCLGAEQVLLLTGDLPEPEALARVRAFAAGAARILVATTVIEVGIDVPAATVMAVVDAGRFGLSQLHQLRGRLGRGGLAGTCLLLHRPDEDEEGLARLKLLAATEDGFAIAEADLAARGPGELLGTRQHGELRLAVADLARDLDLLQQAHEDVRRAAAQGRSMPPGLRRFLATGTQGGLLAGA